MRILFVNAYFDPTWYEGSRVHIEQLTKALTDAGNEVWVPPSSPCTCAMKLSSNPLKWVRQILEIDVYYARLEGRPLSLPLYMSRLFWHLGFRKPMVWEINAASEYVVLVAGSTSDSMRADLDRELRQQASRVTMAVCNTDGLAQYATDLGIPKSITIPLGSDPTMFTPDAPPVPGIVRDSDRLNVVWCGNTTVPWHDFDVIVRTAESLREMDNIRFYIIGGTPSGRRFPANVVLLGSRPYHEMPHLLSSMDVGLAVYKSDSWSRYGVFSSPLKLFDYLSSGLIVVASPIEQVLECIENGTSGFIVPFGDDVALAATLRHICTHKRELEKMGRVGRSLALEYYNWSRVASETVDALQSLIGVRQPE